MNMHEKSKALIECSESLETALNEITDIDEEDDVITRLWWEIKDTKECVDSYIKELNK